MTEKQQHNTQFISLSDMCMHVERDGTTVFDDQENDR